MFIHELYEAKSPTPPKPRNFVAKNAPKAGAGAHKNKKKAAKQGQVKHKSQMAEGIGGTIVGGVGQFFGNKIDPLAGEIMRAHGEIAGRKAEYTIRKYMYLLQKALKQQLDPEEKDESVREGSDWGEPREILEDVLQTLEREVEWPLTEVMDPKEVRQLLSPIIKAVNDKMMSMKEAQDDWGGMSHREFKRRELQHELGHEDDPEFQRQMRENDRGPWYIKIDGKIYKQKGEPKVFDWKKGANNYALAILKNKPELRGKIVLTKKLVDEDVNEEKQKGLDGKACWKGYRRMGTKMKGGKRVDNCVKVGEDLEEAATPGATSSGSIASIANPHLSPGSARGQRSYTGSPGKSGTKAPPQPKPKKQTPSDNALNMKTNIFGEGNAIKR